MSASSEASIRLARSEDYAEARRLMDELDALHRERLPQMFKEPSDPPRSVVFFEEMLALADSVVFVADAGQVVGMAVGLMRAAPELSVFIQQRWGVLDSLIVASAWRRRGIGKLLARAVEMWAVGLGAPRVEVNVYAVNAQAMRFYEALGFTPLSTRLRGPSPSLVSS